MLKVGFDCGLGQANAYQAGANALNDQPAPRTIASAMGRVDSLNERLSAIAGQLSSLSDQIGGPRPIQGAKSVGGNPAEQAVGAVSRLNDGVDRAHSQAGDIEYLLNSISRALG